MVGLEWLAIWGVKTVGNFVLQPVLADLAKDLGKDTAKDLVKDWLKEGIGKSKTRRLVRAVAKPNIRLILINRISRIWTLIKRL
jgi:hypothetical protein